MLTDPDTLARDYLALWNDPDAASRNHRLSDGWAEDARYIDPMMAADLRVHDLRHLAASFMVNSGVDLFAVGRVLGHANVASTARYSRLANDTLLAAVEAGAAKQALPTA